MILQNTVYSDMSAHNVMHLIVSSMLDQSVLLIAAWSYLYLTERRMMSMLKESNLLSKVYICLALPELLKLSAILLWIFDSDPVAFFLIGGIILSVQLLSFRCLTKIQKRKVVIFSLLVFIIRLGVKWSFYHGESLWKLGILM